MKSYDKTRGTERGATAIEYALLGALMILVVIGALAALGGNLEGIFFELAQNLPATR